METNRIINIILSDLALENLKMQEDLEKAVNSNESAEKKVSSAKDLISKIALNEMTIAKFKELVSIP